MTRASEEFGARLRAAMDEEGWPDRGRAARLARVTHLSPAAAGKWVRGEAVPEIETLRAIAAELNRSPSFLQFGPETLDGIPVRYNEDRDTAGAYVDIATGTGNLGTAEHDVPFVRFTKEELDEIGAQPHECCVLIAPRDSDALRLSRGDRMLVHRPSKKLEDGGLYVFRIGEADSIQLVRTNVDGSITLHSDSSSPTVLGDRIEKAAIPSLNVLGRIRIVQSRR